GYGLDRVVGRDVVARDEFAVIVLLDVRRDDGGETLSIEVGEHPGVREVFHDALGALALNVTPTAVAGHDPGGDHGGRADDGVAPGLAGGLDIDVDRIEVVVGLDPVADHGVVDGVPGHARWFGHLPDVFLVILLDGLHGPI